MRYVGPKDKISRKYGEMLSGMPNFELNKRPYPPGQHGLKRTKSSEYGSLLQEKQKLRSIYGIVERQFRRYFKKASKTKGPTGEILIQMLETRLDNLVYRMGFAPTLAMARQLVTHGHVLVDNKKVNVPSFPVKLGSEIKLKEYITKIETIKNSTKNLPLVPPYLTVQKDDFTGKLIEIPQRVDIPINLNDRLIVEFYSR